jgi:L-2-hydroxyglutarate oxidase LhgO
MDKIEVVVIGAGVVGLACARALAQAGHEVMVVEAQAAIGTGVSSRSSEVVHAGLYYEPGSLKARHCVRGRELLYAYCRAHSVSHRRCGKLVVATREEERSALQGLAQRAAANGVTSLRWLEADEATAMEPALHCVAALWSPDTGIVDSHGLMLALQGDAEAAGALCAFHSRIDQIDLQAHGGTVYTADGSMAAGASVQADWIVNCAGLDAPAVAMAMRGFPAERVPTARFAKGSYFSLQGRAPFTHLIYPVPEPGGLGVHLTLDLGGQAKFGPDVEWVDAPDYHVDPQRAEAFYESIRRYWPGLRDGTLVPAYAGVRPKIHGPGGTADFRIDGPREHGAAGVVQLFGIESPGLTSALSIAQAVAAIVSNATPQPP